MHNFIFFCIKAYSQFSTFRPNDVVFKKWEYIAQIFQSLLCLTSVFFAPTLTERERIKLVRMLFIILTDDRQIIVFPDLFKNTRNISFPINSFFTILSYNSFCITESFDTNISHKLFDYKIIFVNSQYENTNSKTGLKR